MSDPGTTASAKVGVVNLGVLSGLMGGVGLNVGDVSVTGSSTVSSPAVTTSAATATPVATAASVVPNVTTVHTGEYWAGPLPIILASGMALAGLILIARRRLASAARAVLRFTRPPTRPSGRKVDRHRARHPGPPPFPLRSRGRPGGSLQRQRRGGATAEEPRRKIFGGSGEG